MLRKPKKARLLMQVKIRDKYRKQLGFTAEQDKIAIEYSPIIIPYLQ